ncbi:MAG: hypothetical protein MUO85_05735 [candidate division Zixibacteria bacterium]|nr:hypothetical protein [candidate division Zixibacteria bacterium]
MKSKLLFFLFVFLLIPDILLAQPLGFNKVTDDVSLYKNFLDELDDAGQTLQIVTINSFKLYFWFDLEICLDYNWYDSGDDYYMEMGLVKPVFKNFKLNYQRIYGTFVNKPINQVGIRFSF